MQPIISWTSGEMVGGGRIQGWNNSRMGHNQGHLRDGAHGTQRGGHSVSVQQDWHLVSFWEHRHRHFCVGCSGRDRPLPTQRFVCWLLVMSERVPKFQCDQTSRRRAVKWLQKRVHLLDTEPFEATFGPRKTHRRPRNTSDDFSATRKKNLANLRTVYSSVGERSYAIVLEHASRNIEAQERLCEGRWNWDDWDDLQIRRGTR